MSNSLSSGHSDLGVALPLDERSVKLIAQYTNLRVLPPTPQLLALHTIVRNRDTVRADFVFYSDRIIRLLVEDAISLLAYRNLRVITPTGAEFAGAAFCDKVCGVSILRGGSSMESALRAVAKAVRIGKILIQRDESDPEKRPVLFYKKLPEDIATRSVLLLDPMLATGGSVIMAIRCLKEAGVPEENITFVNLVSCPEGIHALFEEFPNVRCVTSAIDDGLDQRKYIVPGLGDFGDRYFGTN